MAIRAASLPVNTCLNMEWKELTAFLHFCWEQSTAVANLAAVELERRDVVRLPGMGPRDMPPMPVIPDTKKPKDWKGPKTKGNVLRGLRGLVAVALRTDLGFWAGASSAMDSIVLAVEKKYRKERPEIIWRGERRPARYRYPYPFPVHPRQWDAEFRDGKPVIVWTAPCGKKVELQLRGGPEFGRQLADFRRVVSGEAKKCQLLITRQRAGEGCHRRADEGRAPGGGQRVSYRIMVKLIVHVPERKAEGDRVLTLCTDPGALWVAELDGRRAWVLNADHIQRALAWQETHRARLQRWADDTKAERRCTKRKRRQFGESRERCCSKHARRMKSWCQEAAAHLARFAVRQKVAHVLYRDVPSDNLPGMPWFLLKTCLANALAAAGIALDCTSDKKKAKRKEAACAS